MTREGYSRWYSPLLGISFDLERWNCWTLVREGLCLGYGIDVPEHGEVDASSLEEVAAAVSEESRSWIAVDIPQPGDVVVFDYLGQSAHIGMMVAPGFFMHVSTGTVSRVERLSDRFWARRLVGSWRHRDLA